MYEENRIFSFCGLVTLVFWRKDYPCVDKNSVFVENDYSSSESYHMNS